MVNIGSQCTNVLVLVTSFPNLGVWFIEDGFEHLLSKTVGDTFIDAYFVVVYIPCVTHSKYTNPISAIVRKSVAVENGFPLTVTSYTPPLLHFGDKLFYVIF
jgi:hypothetical protein